MLGCVPFSKAFCNLAAPPSCPVALATAAGGRLVLLAHTHPSRSFTYHEHVHEGSVQLQAPPRMLLLSSRLLSSRLLRRQSSRPCTPAMHTGSLHTHPLTCTHACTRTHTHAHTSTRAPHIHTHPSRSFTLTHTSILWSSRTHPHTSIGAIGHTYPRRLLSHAGIASRGFGLGGSVHPHASTYDSPAPHGLTGYVPSPLTSRRCRRARSL